MSGLAKAFLACAAFVLPVLAADPEPRKIKIVLERLQGATWTAIDPGLVLATGDRVRFRITTSFDGYLYVVDYGTSGAYSILFPSKQAGIENRIKSKQTYAVPEGSDTDFKVSGPAGQEIVYWMVSPVRLPGYGDIPVPNKPQHPATLMPRCDDALMRARGECVDSTAGVRDLGTDQPEELDAAGAPANLTFLREDKNSVIATSGSSQGPMVYEFRISHK